MVPTAVQHEKWKGLYISVVKIPKCVMTKVIITQITADFEQLDLYHCKNAQPR